MTFCQSIELGVSLCIIRFQLWLKSDVENLFITFLSSVRISFQHVFDAILTVTFSNKYLSSWSFFEFYLVSTMPTTITKDL